MSDRADWHARRRTGLGGSDVAALLGLDRYRSPVDLWRLKVGLAQPDAGNDATRHGQACEPWILRQLGARYGLEVGPGLEFVRHPRWDAGVRLLANLDGTIPGGIVEAKTTRSMAQAEALREGRLPTPWALQVHHYAACTGRRFGVLACLHGATGAPPEEGDLIVVRWSAQPELIALIERVAAAWWHDYIEGAKGMAPEYAWHPDANDALSWVGRIEVTPVAPLGAPPKTEKGEAMYNAQINPEGLEYLKKALHPDVIKNLKGKTDGDGKPIRHVEGHYIIDRLNQIWGFDGWSFEVLDAECVYASNEEKVSKSGRPYAQWVVVYRARVRLTVHTAPSLIREDVATGDGQMPSVADAHDLALKTAVTTALKRAARTFGNQFGNSLYGDNALRFRDELYITEGACDDASNEPAPSAPAPPVPAPPAAASVPSKPTPPAAPGATTANGAPTQPPRARFWAAAQAAAKRHAVDAKTLALAICALEPTPSEAWEASHADRWCDSVSRLTRAEAQALVGAEVDAEVLNRALHAEMNRVAKERQLSASELKSTLHAGARRVAGLAPESDWSRVPPRAVAIAAIELRWWDARLASGEADLDALVSGWMAATPVAQAA